MKTILLTLVVLLCSATVSLAQTVVIPTTAPAVAIRQLSYYGPAVATTTYYAPAPAITTYYAPAPAVTTYYAPATVTRTVVASPVVVASPIVATGYVIPPPRIRLRRAAPVLYVAPY